MPIILFMIKLLDQCLRTFFLISINKEKNVIATVVIGIQQLLHVALIVFIVHDYSIPNVVALVLSTMLGTFITTKYVKE